VTKRKKNQSRFLYHTKDHLEIFLEKEWLVGTTLLPEILGKPPRWSDIADVEPIIARCASAITPSEKKFN